MKIDCNCLKIMNAASTHFRNKTVDGFYNSSSVILLGQNKDIIIMICLVLCEVLMAYDKS